MGKIIKREMNQINWLHHSRLIDLGRGREGKERTICENKNRAKYFYGRSHNLVDFAGEKYSQVKVIMRDYHVVDKEKRII